MIGILGGTFDPIHNGHLHIATQVVSRLGLSQVQMMPCALPVHRDQPHATAQQRCAMIERALAENPELVLNTLEIERDGPSYTIDSLRQIRENSDAPLVLASGQGKRSAYLTWSRVAPLASRRRMVSPSLSSVRS